MSNSKIFKLASIFLRTAQEAPALDYQQISNDAHQALGSILMANDIPVGSTRNVDLEASGNSVNLKINLQLQNQQDAERVKQLIMNDPFFSQYSIMFNIF